MRFMGPPEAPRVGQPALISIVLINTMLIDTMLILR